MEITFNNGVRYEIEEAGRDGILVFKDIPFEAPFDKNCCNKWEKSTLKAELEKWWNENAPKELKEKYDVSILTPEEVFDQKRLDHFFGKGEKTSVQLPLFANDWKAKIKRLIGDDRSYWWWLRCGYPWYSNYAAFVSTDGSLGGGRAYIAIGCVPACYPKYLSNSLDSSAFSDGDEK